MTARLAVDRPDDSQAQEAALPRARVTAPVALRASYLAFLYIQQLGDVQRRHVESAGFLLAAVLLVCAVLTLPNDIGVTAGSRPRHLHVVSTLIICAVGTLLYGSTLTIGLLSDDFALLDHARQWQLLPDDWAYVRPVPLAIWATLAHVLGAGAAVSLHAFNVILHVVNALLVFLVGAAVGLGARGALLAACLFITLPTNVEPVAWASGIFDVGVTTLALLMIYGVLKQPPATGRHITVCLLLTVIALFTKETGAAIPCLLATASLMTRHWDRPTAYWPALVSAGCVGAYVLLRLFWKAGGVALPSNGYQAKELFTRPLGTLAAPFHSAVIESSPVIAAVAVAAIPMLLLVLASRWLTRRDTPRLSLALVVWLYAAVAPLGTMLYISPDLQGSRYLYLSSAAWSVGLGAIASAGRAQLVDQLVSLATAMLVCVYLFASLTTLQNWRAAAVVRDTFLREVERAAQRCETSTFTIPDHQAGAFVLRNGAVEALRLRGVAVTLESGVIRLPAC